MELLQPIKKVFRPVWRKLLSLYWSRYFLRRKLESGVYRCKMKLFRNGKGPLKNELLPVK